MANEWEKYLKKQQGALAAPALPDPAVQAKQNAVADSVRTGYVPGASVTQAYQQYQNQAAAKPEAYQSQYDQQIADAFNNIMNRKAFQYDMGADPIYQQMKDRYLQQGKMGMMDTMGQAAAMTGGYGNSYAATAGQQMYDQHLTALNDQLPALHDRAYGKYRDEGQDMYQQLGMMQGLDDREYGRYRDDVSDWGSMLDRAMDLYQNERSFDYGDFTTQTGWNREDQQRQEDWTRQLQLRNEEWARQDQQAAAAAAAAAASSGRRSSSPGKKRWTDEEVMELIYELDKKNKKPVLPTTPRYGNPSNISG
jgi:hypothetical protein